MSRPARKTVLRVGLLGVVMLMGLVVHHKLVRWKRFDVVTEQKLYRSGLLHDWQLRRAIRDYGIRTVFAFNFENNEQEERTCRELGVERFLCFLPGDGVGPNDPYLRFVKVVSDPAHQPVLVHCAAGVQRTGGSVALYRTLVENWDFDRAIAEMIAKGNDGDAEQIEQLRQIVDDVKVATGLTCPVPATAFRDR